jgi:hypothetical protein
MKFPLRRLTLALLVTAAAGFAQSGDSAQDLRRPHRWGLSAEIGMNSLSSLIGPVLTVYVKPAIALDLGAGLSAGGLRPGLRARYLFTPNDKVSYFAGAGFKEALGSGGQEVKVKDPDTKEELGIKVSPASFADLMVGSEYQAGNGFLVIANAGYSFLLNGKSYEFTAGAPSDKAIKTFDTIFGSGVMLSVSLGWAI